MALWSGLTLGSTFVAVDSFGGFVALAALTGVGEASFSTLAPAIISDLFARDQRARYLAAYALCIPVGRCQSTAFSHLSTKQDDEPQSSSISIFYTYLFSRVPIS